MNIPGKVQNRVVVLEPGPVLPDGTDVTVLCPDSKTPEVDGQRRRVQLPLVPSERPGNVLLTAERVAELTK